MGNCFGGGSSQTTVQNNAPPPQFMAAYEDVLNRAQTAANQPLTQYSGPLVAGFTPDQIAGMNQIRANANTAAPYLNAAAGEFGAATTPIWSNVPQYGNDTISKYLNPFTQNVLNTTEQQFNNLNQQQQQGLASQAIAQKAFGGDRAGVASGIMAGQQASAEAPVLAGIASQGFQQAQQEFNQQQQAEIAANEANAWLASQAGFGIANLGGEAQNLENAGAQQLLGIGGLQQQLQQQQLNIPYEQFLQRQAYPFQTTSWLGGIAEGTGAGAGGVGTTTSPGPSPISQVAGLGLTGAALYGIGNNAGWWGGGLTGTPTFSQGPISAVGGTAMAIPAEAHGGRLYRRVGHVPYRRPMGGGIPGLDLSDYPGDVGIGIASGVPDVSASPVPSGGIAGAPAFMSRNYGQTASTPGKDNTLSTILTIAEIAGAVASDPALKHVRGRTTDALDRVRRLHVKDARYKGEEHGSERPMLMADNVERVMPHAVLGRSPHRMVNYHALIPTVVQAIKDLDRRIPRRAPGGGLGTSLGGNFSDTLGSRGDEASAIDAILGLFGAQGSRGQPAPMAGEAGPSPASTGIAAGTAPSFIRGGNGVMIPMLNTAPPTSGGIADSLPANLTSDFSAPGGTFANIAAAPPAPAGPPPATQQSVFFGGRNIPVTSADQQQASLFRQEDPSLSPTEALNQAVYADNFQNNSEHGQARGGGIAGYDDGGDIDEEDTGLPPGVAEPEGEGIAAGAPDYAPSYTPRATLSGRGQQMRERAGNHALLAAGLGLLASRSPFPGVALGQAGLGALRAYEGAQERADTIDEKEQESIDRGLYQKANLDMHAKRFADQAKETAQRIKIEGDRAANTAKHEADTLAETSRYHNIEAGNQRDRLQIERDREAREAGQGQWEPQAPVIDPVTKQPKTDPATGAPLWQWFDKKNNKTMQGPYQPVPAKETGDANARLVQDTNAQFGHLLQERRALDADPTIRPKDWKRPTDDDLWMQAQERVRKSYGLGRPGLTPGPGGNDPLNLGAPPAPGTIIQGYRFKGGNPNDQASWEPAG